MGVDFDASRKINLRISPPQVQGRGSISKVLLLHCKTPISIHMLHRTHLLAEKNFQYSSLKTSINLRCIKRIRLHKDLTGCGHGNKSSSSCRLSLSISLQHDAWIRTLGILLLFLWRSVKGEVVVF